MTVSWVNISKAQAIEAVRRRAGEISSDNIHILRQCFDTEWWSADEIELYIVRSAAVFWAPDAPHRHELALVGRHDGYVFTDVQQFPQARRLGTRRVDVMEMKEVGDYVGNRRVDRS